MRKEGRKTLNEMGGRCRGWFARAEREMFRSEDKCEQNVWDGKKPRILGGLWSECMSYICVYKYTYTNVQLLASSATHLSHSAVEVQQKKAVVLSLCK
jgi:hypothetical protein